MLRKKRLSYYCIMIGYWQGNSRFGRRKIADSKNVKIFRIEKVVLREICRRSKFGLSDSPINRNGLREYCLLTTVEWYEIGADYKRSKWEAERMKAEKARD